MELVKRHIHMNRRRGSVTSQMTLDDDFNVPDTMDDVEQLILDSGEIQIESAKNQGEKVAVKGKLNFRILYRTPSGQVMTLAGGIPFEENVNMPGLSESDYVQAGWELDDLNVGIINSRKLNVKALVTLKIQAETIYDAEAAVDVKFDGNVETLKRTSTVAALGVRRKDTFRVKEVLTLSGNKPDIDTLLWQDIKLRGVNTKPLDGKVHIDGELMVFAIYAGEDGQMPVQCMEESIPFSGEVELDESVEEMIPFITVRLVHKDMEVNPDSDGEMREISVDVVMELDMRLYEEEEVELLSDLYALDREILPDTGDACFDQIAARNLLKNKIQEKVSLPVGQRILQICHSDGDVKIDEIQIGDGELSIDGVLEVRLLYLTADDASPVGASTEMLPFHMIAEVPSTSPNSAYQVEPGIEQISAVMLGGDTVEIKGVITADILVLRQVCEQVILDVKEQPVNVEALKQMPGIVGYLVQPGDSLWKIARTFHTSVEDIMTANNLPDSSIHPGDKLILVKAVRERE
ncbi:SPOCS domain-containing protein [Lachnospiraceae bacterium 45-P1]